MKPKLSASAQLRAKMERGQWVTRDDASALGVSTSIVGQVVAGLRDSGADVETKPAGPNGLTAFRVAVGGPSTNGHAPEAVPYPPIGSKVTVKAVAMGARGAYVVHLSDGNGGAWSATVTGYVGGEP